MESAALAYEHNMPRGVLRHRHLRLRRALRHAFAEQPAQSTTHCIAANQTDNPDVSQRSQEQRFWFDQWRDFRQGPEASGP